MATGVVSYVLDNADADTQALDADQRVSDTFNVAVIDNLGATASVDASFSIIGANDAPSIVAAAQVGTITEEGFAINGGVEAAVGNGAASITLTTSDVDGTNPTYDLNWMTAFGWSTANSGVTYTKVGTYGTATLTTATGVVAYALNNADADTQALAAGVQVTETFRIATGDGALMRGVDAVFTINGSDDRPTTSDKTVEVAESTTKVLTLADFGFSDVDTGDQLAFVRINTLPTTGTLFNDTTAITVNTPPGYAQVSRADILANKLKYTPAAGSEETRSFSFSVVDASGISSSAATMELDIVPVNIAPTTSFISATSAGFTISAYDPDLSNKLNLTSAVSGDTAVTNSYPQALGSLLTPFTTTYGIIGQLINLSVTDGLNDVAVKVNNDKIILYLGTTSADSPGAIGAGLPACCMATPAPIPSLAALVMTPSSVAPVRTP